MEHEIQLLCDYLKKYIAHYQKMCNIYRVFQKELYKFESV